MIRMPWDRSPQEEEEEALEHAAELATKHHPQTKALHTSIKEGMRAGGKQASHGQSGVVSMAMSEPVRKHGKGKK